MIAGYVTLCDFSCNLCRNKIARQAARKIAQCNTAFSGGGGLEAPLSFTMTHWSCYWEKVFVIGWRKEILWTRDGEGLH